MIVKKIILLDFSKDSKITDILSYALKESKKYNAIIRFKFKGVEMDVSFKEDISVYHQIGKLLDNYYCGLRNVM